MMVKYFKLTVSRFCDLKHSALNSGFGIYIDETNKLLLLYRESQWIFQTIYILIFLKSMKKKRKKENNGSNFY